MSEGNKNETTPTPENVLRRALTALRLEVDESVANHIENIALAALDDVRHSERERIRTALQASRVGPKFETDVVWNRAIDFALATVSLEILKE